MRRLIIALTYYQILFAIQLKMTVFKEDDVTLIITDHSNNSEFVSKRIRENSIFEQVCYVEIKELLEKKDIFIRIKQFVDVCFNKTNKYEIYLKEINNIYFDDLLVFNLFRDTICLYSILSSENKNIRFSRFEEGILSYNNDFFKLVTNKRVIMDFVRKCLGKPQFLKSADFFYCFYPDLYKGELTPICVPLISDTKETVEAIKTIFELKEIENDYKEKYIFFTSVLDFEGEHPIGEYELVCKIAERVGKGNLLIKIHPRDRRTVYSDNGFKVDRNSSIPWEAIQLSGNFSDKVFLTATSGSVLSGSFMSSTPPKTFYLYKLCNIDGNTKAKEARRSINELLTNKEMRPIFSSVKALDNIEDINK